MLPCMRAEELWPWPQQSHQDHRSLGQPSREWVSLCHFNWYICYLDYTSYCNLSSSGLWWYWLTVTLTTASTSTPPPWLQLHFLYKQEQASNLTFLDLQQRKLWSCCQTLKGDKLTGSSNPKSFWGSQDFTMTPRREPTAFSTIWILVRITNSGNANISKTLFVNVEKKNPCKFHGIDLNPSLTDQTDSQIRTPVNQQPEFPVYCLFLRMGFLPLSLVLGLPSPTTMGLEVSNIYPRKNFTINS